MRLFHSIRTLHTRRPLRTTRPGERGRLNPGDVSPASINDFLAGESPFYVASSNLRVVSYDPNAQEVIIEYHAKGNGSGAMWAYKIPPEMARDMAEAWSKGEWTWSHIRIRGKGHKHDHQVPARRLR